MASKIKIKRGTKVQLPNLELAEPGFTTDTKELYIGDGIGNVKIGKDSFLELSDTPAAYSGAAGKNVIVKSDGTGLDFSSTVGSGRQFSIELKKSTDSMSSNTWFDLNGGAQVTGSWSGYSSNTISPTVIPFNCTLKTVVVILKGAASNWSASEIPIYFGLGFYTHQYNGATEHNLFKIILSGTYSLNGFNNQNHNSIIENPIIYSGTNSFSVGSLIGTQFRMTDSEAGSIYTLRRPYVRLIFEEI